MVVRGREFWVATVGEFKRSGMTQEEFCRARSLSLGTFQHWYYRQLRPTTLARPSPAMVRVRMSAPPATAPIEASIAGGVVLRFLAGADPQYIATLIRSVGAPRC